MTNVYIKTFGCSLNQADSESIAGLLKKAGYNIIDDTEVDNLDKADVIIINTCVVKKQTENSVLRLLKSLEQDHPDVPKIIAGCMPQVPDFIDKLKGFSLLGTDQVRNVVHVVEEVLAGNTVIMLDRMSVEAGAGDERLNLPIVKKNNLIEIIPISKGCLGDCSYCVVKLARGKLFSYSKDAIVARAKKAVEAGAKEIWITSQDCGAYGLDIGSNLPELLKGLIAIKGAFKIRLGMSNPNFVLKYLDELIEIFKSDKMFKFLHIPVQAGNDQVLKDMNRYYTVDDFMKIIKAFRDEMPEIAIATDFIVGFPTENETQFDDSMILLRIADFDVLNLSRFFARPSTKAAEMKQIVSKFIKERSRKMAAEFLELAAERNKRWLDWEGEIIVDEPGKNKTMMGRNYCYKPVIIKANSDLLGRIVRVKIKEVSAHDLRGEII